ncbi:MAG: TetR/AcrR family transcriptional regulator [Flammeovirgaceae bacterium]
MKNNRRKETIMKAASECFSRYGYEKTTLDDIGKTAKLNKASLYYYFKNKEEIFIQVILEESQKYISALQKSVDDFKTCEEKITHYLIERIRYYKNVLNLNQLSIEILHQIEPIFDQLYNTLLEQEIQFIQQILDEAIKKEGYAVIDTKKVAESIIDMSTGLKHETVRRSGALQAKEIDYTKTEEKIRLLTSLILKGMKN